MARTQTSILELPGGDLVAAGLADRLRGIESIPALLVEIAAPRLRGLGFDVPPQARVGLPEHRLYEVLALTEGDNAHAQYNALIRRLVSFARAYECAIDPLAFRRRVEAFVRT